VTQQGHLTTEQLSAFLDKQLTPQEQAFFDAHLQSCQRCQQALGDLRLTVALLHAMPRPELPRSFTLPAGISQIHAARPPVQPAQQRRVLSYTLRRTMRAVSTLAAAVAVIFILSGLLANLHLGAFPAATSAPSAFNGSSNNTTHSAAGNAPTQLPQKTASTPNVVGTPMMRGHLTGTPTKSPAASRPTPTPQATSTGLNGVNDRGANPSNQPPALSAALDLSQPQGRLSLGALLLLLSIVGIIITRRRRDTI
jgi:putative zinc finger protein